MAKRIANGMAIAMAVVSEQNMAHSTPLHYSRAGSHSSSGGWGLARVVEHLTRGSWRAMNELRRGGLR